MKQLMYEMRKKFPKTVLNTLLLGTIYSEMKANYFVKTQYIVLERIVEDD